MRSERTVVDLVGLIYDAAVDPKVWTPFLEKLEQIIGTPWCFFYVHDFSRRKVDITAEIGFDPSYVRSYQEYYASKCSRMTRDSGRVSVHSR